MKGEAGQACEDLLRMCARRRPIATAAHVRMSTVRKGYLPIQFVDAIRFKTSTGAAGGIWFRDRAWVAVAIVLSVKLRARGYLACRYTC